MAVTSETNQVTWSAANTKSVASSGVETSDDYTFDTNAFEATLVCKANNSGTPASGDTLNIYAQIKEDPDLDSTQEYANQMDFVGSLDTNADDPAIARIQMSVEPGQTYRFAMENDGASSITGSIRVIEKKSA